VINEIPYNIQWEDKHPIIFDNNESRIDTLPLVDEIAEPAIISYLAYLVRKGGVDQIHFILAQCAVESCPISKILGDVTKLLADIQKKWLKSCLEGLNLLKNRNIYEVENLSKKRKVIKVNFFDLRKSFCNKLRSIITIRLNVEHSVIFDELFSLVVYYETVCLFPAVIFLEDWDIYSIDIKAANLYSDLDKEIYIK